MQGQDLSFENLKGWSGRSSLSLTPNRRSETGPVRPQGPATVLRLAGSRTGDKHPARGVEEWAAVRREASREGGFEEHDGQRAGPCWIQGGEFFPSQAACNRLHSGNCAGSRSASAPTDMRARCLRSRVAGGAGRCRSRTPSPSGPLGGLALLPGAARRAACWACSSGPRTAHGSVTFGGRRACACAAGGLGLGCPCEMRGGCLGARLLRDVGGGRARLGARGVRAGGTAMAAADSMTQRMVWVDLEVSEGSRVGPGGGGWGAEALSDSGLRVQPSGLRWAAPRGAPR